MSPLLVQILAVLRSHVGRENLISSRAIAREIGLRQRDSSRVVRDLLAQAMLDGTLEELETPVVGIPGQGFFIVADIEEAQRYSDLLQALRAELTRKIRAADSLFRSLGLSLHTKSTT